MKQIEKDEQVIRQRMKRVDCEHMAFTKSEVKSLLFIIDKQRRNLIRFKDELEISKKTIAEIQTMINPR